MTEELAVDLEGSGNWNRSHSSQISSDSCNASSVPWRQTPGSSPGPPIHWLCDLRKLFLCLSFHVSKMEPIVVFTSCG